MATFARATFNAAAYESFRPTYPPRLFKILYYYHQRGGGGWKKVIDIGCGTGQATVVLADKFEEVVGVDPSQKMVDQANSSLRDQDKSNLTYVKSSAESLPFLSDASVDLVTVGQAAHWFDHSKFWTEVHRVLRPSGSVAIWGYSEFRLRNFKSTTPLITAYSQGSGPRSLGPYWQQPGRSILDNNYVQVAASVPTGAQGFRDVQHLKFTGEYYPEFESEAQDLIMRKRVNWEDLRSYLGTWSSLHSYKARHDDGEELVDSFLNDLKEAAHKESEQSAQGVDSIELEWPATMILARKPGST